MDKLSDILKSNGLTISVAESCTAGLLASQLTDIPGSSKYFIAGIVAYSRDIKTSLLNVPEYIEVVSDKCAIAMNQGLTKLVKSDIHVSVTGNIGENDNPKLSNVVYFSILYNCIDYAFKIDLEKSFNKRVEAKQFIVSIIIDKLSKVIEGKDYLT